MPPASAAGRRARLKGDLPWRILVLLACYRLLVPLLLIALQRLGGHWMQLPAQPGLFLGACAGYLALAAALLVASLRRLAGLCALTSVGAGADVLLLALIVYASGGISSGLGTLLVLPVMATAAIAGPREGTQLAGLAAAGLIVQQMLAERAQGALASDWAATATLGVLLAAIALPAQVIAQGIGQRLPQRLREPQGLPWHQRHQPTDLENLGQLSQYIVRHLRESILVIDSEDGIRLINGSAVQLLGPASARQDAHLGEVCPRLLQLLSAWRAGLAAGKGLDCADPTFTAADGSRLIRAHFVALPATAPAPVIVFLEEPDLLELRAQQSRLGALARLSASIAHEVKNPVHAMSQAGQLLAESPGLSDQDRRLTQIIRTNAERVSRIIDSVLELSRGERTRLTQLPLGSWTEEFRQEFCDTMQWPLARLPVRGPVHPLEVQADPGQLRQILWNLCENALRHAAVPDNGQPVELVYGRLAATARPFLEVNDRGPGVAPEHVERIFEPFFTQGSGTGMGLYLARELAHTNGATLLYQPRPGGGSTFRIIFTDPRRWEGRTL